MKLLTLEASWSDEFDVEGFCVICDLEWTIFEAQIRSAIYPIENYFGTNQYLIFENADEVLRSFKVQDIEDDEYQVLMRLFDGKFGHNPHDMRDIFT